MTSAFFPVIFQDRPKCLATSIKAPRRDLKNDMAEHMSTLKTNQNTYYPRFIFISRKELPKIGVLFFLGTNTKT